MSDNFDETTVNRDALGRFDLSKSDQLDCTLTAERPKVVAAQSFNVSLDQSQSGDYGSDGDYGLGMVQTADEALYALGEGDWQYRMDSPWKRGRHVYETVCGYLSIGSLLVISRAGQDCQIDEFSVTWNEAAQNLSVSFCDTRTGSTECFDVAPLSPAASDYLELLAYDGDIPSDTDFTEIDDAVFRSAQTLYHHPDMERSWLGALELLETIQKTGPLDAKLVEVVAVLFQDYKGDLTDLIIACRAAVND